MMYLIVFIDLTVFDRYHRLKFVLRHINLFDEIADPMRQFPIFRELKSN